MKFSESCKQILKEARIFSIINGKEFKKKYITTNSKQLEKAIFSDNSEPMGNVLGRGLYFSVTSHSSDHYENDDYYEDTEYFNLSDDAKILILPNSYKLKNTEIQKLAKTNKADGVYDPTEGKNNNPYLGLVIFNTEVINKK